MYNQIFTPFMSLLIGKIRLQYQFLLFFFIFLLHDGNLKFFLLLLLFLIVYGFLVM